MKKKVLSFVLLAVLVIFAFSSCMNTVEFEIKFVSDGEVIHTIKTSGEEAVSLPQNPEKDGYVFDGWFWDEGTWQRPFTANSLLNEPLSGDMSVYAKWSIDQSENSFNVSYNTMGGSSVATEAVKYNSLASKPTDPTKDGYIFDGWYKDASLESKWDFASDKVTENIILYAKWVAQEQEEGAEIISAGDFVLDGKKLTITVPYTVETLAFSEYIVVSPGATYTVSTDVQGNNQIASGTVALVEGENTVYILVVSKNGSVKTQYTAVITKEEAPEVTITLDPNGGEISTSELEVKIGNTIDSLPTPTQYGYKLVGWTVDGKEITLPYTVTKEVTIVAKWEKLETVTLYLDPNGGVLPEGESDEIEKIVGEKIGELPTPTRPGYTFIGWFEDGDERYEIDRKSEAEDYDMELVALWEPMGEIASVEFTLALGEEWTNPDVKIYYEVLLGDRISTVLQSLPTATKDGYRFNGWQDKATNQTVTVTTKVEGDMVLVPKWEKIVYCIDGTENHIWNAWQESSDATCTDPAKTSRQCDVCGYTEYKITQEALGHSYGEHIITVSDNGSLSRSRVCTNCDGINIDILNNITFDNFNTPVIDGDVFGGANVGCLVNGNFTDTNVAGKGSSAVTVTLNAKSATYIDIFTVTGQGRGSYTVTVTYKDGTEKTLGLGAFGSGASATKAFIVEAEVTKIVVYMETPACGTDYWSELAACVVAEKTDGHAFGNYITTVDSDGAVKRSRTCLDCGEVETEVLKNITFDNFCTPVINGDVWNGDKGDILIDGNFADANVAGKGSSSVTVTLHAKSATYIDAITVTGQGSASYTVTVTYEDGTEKTLGLGTFGSGAGATTMFTVLTKVTKIVVYMESPSNSADRWSEIAAYTVAEKTDGHAFGNYVVTVDDYGSTIRSRTCLDCGEVETEVLKNITFDNFNTPVIEGDVYGGDKGANLIDGNFTDKNVCTKGYPVAVTLNAKSATYVDTFIVAGQGESAYTVTVTYEDGTEKVLGIGSFSSGDDVTRAFTIEAEVTKIVVYMENSSNGEDFWTELAACTVKE